MNQIAKELGVNRSTVKRWFDRAGIKPNGEGVTLKELICAGTKRPGTECGQEYATPFESLCESWDFDYRPRQMEDSDFDAFMEKRLAKLTPKAL
jgi:hypothetical protein